MEKQILEKLDKIIELLENMSNKTRIKTKCIYKDPKKEIDAKIIEFIKNLPSGLYLLPELGKKYLLEVEAFSEESIDIYLKGYYGNIIRKAIEKAFKADLRYEITKINPKTGRHFPRNAYGLIVK